MKAQPFLLSESGGDNHPTLELAQRASLQDIASVVARIVRNGIAQGRFVVQDGIVRLAEEATMDTGGAP
jgi:hypothetical protein